MTTLNNTLYIVVPCYNEEETLRETARRLRYKTESLKNAGKISEGSKIVFVNDGSRDNTWSLIEELCRSDDVFAGISLSRNRGHQYALYAGLMAVRKAADMAVSMDADLQDDIDAIDKMVDGYLRGCDVVYGVRSKREKDRFFKRFTAEGYYKLLRALGCDIVFNHADYRLLSARALEALSGYREQGLFLRGLIPMLGYKTATVEYERGERFAGESKYTLGKMLSLAFDGATGLSIKPLRMIALAGALMLLIAAALLIYSVVSLCIGGTILNWKLITFSIWFVGGIITLSLGIVGEYAGRTFFETKRRPRYFIETAIGVAVSQDDRDTEVFN